MKYVKIDLTKPKVQEALDLYTTDFALDFFDNILSVNRNAAGTLAWVKLSKGLILPNGLKSVVLEVHTDNQAALADCYSPGWYSEEV